MDEFQLVENSNNFFSYFIAGGVGPMSVLSLLLIFILFAAWKAPRWIKEIGTFALVFGFLTYIIGLYQMFDVLQEVADAQGEGITGLFDLISPSILFAGLRIGLIPVIYGVIIYLISLVVRVIVKPRL